MYSRFPILHAFAGIYGRADWANRILSPLLKQGITRSETLKDGTRFPFHLFFLAPRPLNSVSERRKAGSGRGAPLLELPRNLGGARFPILPLLFSSSSPDSSHLAVTAR